MNKFICLFLFSGIFFLSTRYYGSTTAPVAIAGGIIKAKHSDGIQVKHKRKDCPVCKGKGWYWSGDGIKKVECGYCEPEPGQVDHKESAISQQCEDNKCKTKIIKK